MREEVGEKQGSALTEGNDDMAGQDMKGKGVRRVTEVKGVRGVTVWMDNHLTSTQWWC